MKAGCPLIWVGKCLAIKPEKHHEGRLSAREAGLSFLGRRGDAIKIQAWFGHPGLNTDGTFKLMLA